MKLGSNNSLTYLEPSKWWLKPFKFFTRHQRKDYKFQYIYCGVRYFDIRVSADNNNHLVLKNKKNIYNIFSLYEILDFFNKYCDVTICFTLDESFSEYMLGEHKRIENKFIQYCRIVETIYKDITFCGGYRKFDKKLLYDFKNDTPYVVDVNECSVFYSVMSRLFPFLRKMFNARYVEKFRRDNGFLVLNYVDYK